MSRRIRQVESAILNVLGQPGVDRRLGHGRIGLVRTVAGGFPQDQQPNSHEVMEALWRLVGRGLAFIDFSQPDTANWTLVATQLAASGAHSVATADEPEAFLEWLNSELPVDSGAVFQYASEALIAYNSGCYLASSVLLEVALEASMLDLAVAFGQALPDGRRQIFLQVVDNPRTNSVAKLLELRKRLEPYRQAIPEELADGLSTTMDSVLNFFHAHRNELSQPVETQVSRDDAFVRLQLFARHVQRFYRLAKWLEANDLPTDQ